MYSLILGASPWYASARLSICANTTMQQRISDETNNAISDVLTSSKNGKSIDAEIGIATAQFKISINDIPIMNNIRKAIGSYARIRPPKEASPFPPLKCI